MKAKLTDTGVRCYQPRAAQYAIGDAACPGLCIRITPKGIKTFAFAYRDKGTGNVMWLTFGRYPDVPLAQARELANDARKIIAAGGTPLTPKVQRAEAEKKLRPTPNWSNSTSTPSRPRSAAGTAPIGRCNVSGASTAGMSDPLLRSPMTMRPPYCTILPTSAARSRWRTRPSTSRTRCSNGRSSPAASS